MSDVQHNARITYRHDFNDELSVFRIAPEGWELPPFTAGQYAELAIIPTMSEPLPDGKKPKLERRSYSIATAPRQAKELEFYIVKVEGGFLTPQLWKLKPGDSIWLGPKIKGKFTLDEVPAQQDLIMVSTGTGLAPFLSMIRQHQDQPTWRNVVLIHGARFERDLGYRDELAALSDKYHWFTYLPTLTREAPNSGWTGARGRVQQLFERGLVDDALGHPLRREDSHILLCGNPQMIDELEALLLEKGLHPHKKKTPGNIHVERYW